MKTLWVCACLFVLPYGWLCEPTWAMPYCDDVQAFNPAVGCELKGTMEYPGGTLAEYNYWKDKQPGNVRVTLGDESCQAKMEQAMRAWDDFIRELENGYPIPAIPGEQWRYDKWNEAKRECWRKP